MCLRHELTRCDTMSMSVDVFLYDWNILVDAIVDDCGHHRKVVEDILHMYGEKICDKYVIPGVI